MKITEINQAANQFNANVEVEIPKGFISFYQLVKEGKIVPITNESDDIIGFNTVTDIPTSLKVCKMVDGHMTVGDTEAQRNEDEMKLKRFLLEYEGQDLQKWFETSLILLKSNIEVDDVIFNTDDEMYILDATHKKVYDLEGNTISDLSDDPDLEGASKSIILKLLYSSINTNF